MTYARLHHGWIAALVLAACGAPAQQPPHLGPQLGESTAPGPTFGDAPAPDNGGVKEVSARVHGQMTPVANPVIAVDTMPSTTGANAGAAVSETPNATLVAPGVLVPGATNPAVTASTPTGSTSGNPIGTGTAGPNGPGTGNGPATPTTSQPGTTQIPTVNGPAAPITTPTPSPTTPATPTPSPATPQPIQPQPVQPQPVQPQPVQPAPVAPPTPAIPVTPR